MSGESAQRTWGLGLVAVLAFLLGLVTMLAGGTVLFGPAGIQKQAGAALAFVVWFNFLAGFAYVLAGAGLWLRRRWAVMLALAIAVATLIVFAFFGFHVLSGGAYEIRTVWALLFRSGLWFAIAATAHRAIPR